MNTKVHDNIAKSQRKFFIQEQIRILQDELGDEDSSPELTKLREDIRKAKMPKAVEEKALEEFNKLKNPPLSPKSPVIRGYLETMVGVPWHKRTKDNLNIDHVKAILDEDHFGLEKPKERVLEHIAVLNYREIRARSSVSSGLRRGQDLPGEIHRPCPGPPAGAHFARRREG